MFRRSLESLVTSFILVGAIIIMIASATFVEKWHGAQVAREIIYHNPLTIVLWLLLIVNSIFVAIKRRWIERRAWGVIILHFAFIVTLLGAFITHTFSYEGLLHLREGESSNVINTSDGARKLPFDVKLIDFTLERYSGTQMPSAYKSEVEIIVDGEVVERALIAVNRVYDRGGFRLFQSSYDGDEKGSVLSVNCDRVGMITTYSGYLLMLIGILLLILGPKSHFNRLVRELNAIRLVGLIVLSCGVSPLMAQNTIPREHSKKVERLLIQNSSGRIEPIDSFSAKLLRKLSKRSTFEGYSAVEVVWGFIFNPQYWRKVDIISQKSEQIAQEFGLEVGLISFDDFFDANGDYILSEAVIAASETDEASRGKRDKELLKVDERVNIIYTLLSGSIVKLFPLPNDSEGRWFSIDDEMSEFRGDDSMFVTKIFPWYTQTIFQSSGSGDWSEADDALRMIDVYQRKRSAADVPSSEQVTVEILYNKIDPFFLVMIGYLISGVLLFFGALRSSRGGWVAIALLSLCFFVQTISIAARWYISEQMPWASAYETMIHVGWAAALAAIVFSRRSMLASSLASFCGGVVLFVAALNWLDPQITPLVPVLKSSWLMIHVATITSAYGLMGISAMIGVVGMVMTLMKRNDLLHELRLVSEITLHVALYFMIVGIFVGAVWANESWGRYWGWDPKETWALITMLLYAMALHLRFTPFLRSDYGHFTISVLCFSSVLMTYFGVNYYLTGLHAYASGQMPKSIYIIYIFYLLFIVAAIIAHLKNNKK